MLRLILTESRQLLMRRSQARRVEQATPVFRESYAQRSGIEFTNSGLQNRLGLGWLKVRGRGAVFRTLLLKVSGWNVLRAATSAKLRAVVRDLIAQLLKTGWPRPLGQPHLAIPACLNRFQQPRCQLQQPLTQFQQHNPPRNLRPTTITRGLKNPQRQLNFAV